MSIILFSLAAWFFYWLFKPSSTANLINIHRPLEENQTYQLEQFLLRKKDYLASKTWKDKRALVLARDHHRCRSCGTYQNLTVHHDKGYDLIPDEPITCLRTLCRRCHTALHTIHGFPQTLADYYKWDTTDIEFHHPICKVTHEQDSQA